MKVKQTNIADLNSQFTKEDESLNEIPVKLTPLQKLTGLMALVLLVVFLILVITSLRYWDGIKDGAYSDLWEYTKITGSTIIGAVVATYLQTNNN